MTDPTSPDSAGWLHDIETAKSLFSHPSLSNNQLAYRCFEVISRLGSPTYSTAKPQFPQSPNQLFGNTSFRGIFLPDMGDGLDQGMDFSEWVNFTPQGEFLGDLPVD